MQTRCEAPDKHVSSIQESVNYLQCLLGNRPKTTVTKAPQKSYLCGVEGVIPTRLDDESLEPKVPYFCLR